MDKKIYWFWLSLIAGLGQKRIEELITCFDSAEGVYHSTKKELLKLKTLNEEVINKMLAERNMDKLITMYNNLKQKGIYFVTYEEEEFPERLQFISERPYYLYYKGKLPENDRPAIAIVGSRECSEYGKKTGIMFSRYLASGGVNIISGLANGIDSYAHSGALDGGGRTYGVMGNGIDICYPQGNIELYMRITESGGVLSEYPPGRAPVPYNFPMRNRIISGLSDGILVIEARNKSGTLITVDWGLEQGKDIFTIPGRIGDSLSAGCNNLIKLGAKLVTEPGEVEEEIHHLFPEYKTIHLPENQKKNKELAREEKIVYAILSLQPKHIEHIIEETGMMAERLAVVLFKLEMKGYIKEIEKNYYIIN